MKGYKINIPRYIYTELLKIVLLENCSEKKIAIKRQINTTFMRIKIDYMVNYQLLPVYNMQVEVCD